MRRILFVTVLLSIVSGIGRAETHRCTVDAQKALSNRPDELTIRTNSAIDIGSFDVTVAKDADISKVYRLPGTHLLPQITRSRGCFSRIHACHLGYASTFVR